MLFWLFVIALVVGIILIVLGSKSWHGDKYKWFYYHDEGLIVSGIITVAVSSIALFIMLVSIICDYTCANGTLQEYRERYKALTYKVESGVCRDEFGLLNKEVVDEIQEWNEDVVYRKEMQNNFWIGIFYPDIYDGFETIDYEKYAKE
jgi:polyferredoxin